MNKQNSPDIIAAQTPGLGRRDLLKLTGLGVAALGVVAATGTPTLAQETPAWDKTFPKSDRVDHRSHIYGDAQVATRLLTDRTGSCRGTSHSGSSG